MSRSLVVMTLCFLSVFPSALRGQADRSVLEVGATQKQGRQQSIIERFIEFAESHEAYVLMDERALIEEFSRRREEPSPHWETFIPEALSRAYPRFQQGLQAFRDGHYAYCAMIMRERSFDPDPYLASHATLFQAKALILQANIEPALQLLAASLRPERTLRDYCLLDAEFQFWLGYCQFHAFKYDHALKTFEVFIENHPDAEPSMIQEAQTLLKEARSPQPAGLQQVASLTRSAGTLLAEGTTGLQTLIQQRQAMIILEKLIRNAEEGEQSQQQQSLMTTGGARRSGIIHDDARPGTLHDPRRVTPGEVWGQLRPEQREKIMQNLQERFPTRYRQLVEQYYDELAREE